MVKHRAVSFIVIGIITATVFVSGPFMPADFTAHDSPCEGGVLSSEGSATIEPLSVPESATFTRSEFGAEVWKLDVPDATVQATDVQGCVRLTYEINIDRLGFSSLSATTVSDDSPETVQLSIPQSTLSPDRITEDQYNAEVRLIYHGMENGNTVERPVTSQNITVEVTE